MKIRISTNNAAFDDNPNELNRILLDAQRRIEEGETDFNLLDTNGNTVGFVKDAKRGD